jgi:hypothetical protein
MKATTCHARTALAFCVVLFSTLVSGQDYRSAAQARAALEMKFYTESWKQVSDDFRTEYLGLNSVEMDGEIAKAWFKIKFQKPVPIPIEGRWVDIYGGYSYNEFNCENNTIANRIVISVGKNNDYQDPIISNPPKIEQVESGSRMDRLVIAACTYGRTGIFPNINAEIAAKTGRRAFESAEKQKLSPTHSPPRDNPLTVEEQVAQAKNSNPYLVHWEAHDPSAWEEALRQDEVLRANPKWAAKSYDVRFIEVVRRVRAIMPQASSPEVSNLEGALK